MTEATTTTTEPSPPRAPARFGALTIVLISGLALALVVIVGLAFGLASANGTLAAQKEQDSAALADANQKVADAATSRSACVAEINGLIAAYNDLDNAVGHYTDAIREALLDYNATLADIGAGNTSRAQADTANSDAATAGVTC